VRRAFEMGDGGEVFFGRHATRVEWCATATLFCFSPPLPPARAVWLVIKD
jgi:hypothetical protein